MKYIALLRGINVGKTKRIEMKKLKDLFTSLGYANVSTYINSGNIIFETTEKQAGLRPNIEKNIKKAFGLDIQTLVKSAKEMKKISDAIPGDWKNDTDQRTDVAYLFPEIDSKGITEKLPVNKEYIDVRYVKGAVFWNIDRKNYNKSRLNNLIGHKLYQLMTVRNVNTARYLADQ